MFRLICVQYKKVFLRNDVKWILIIFTILPILISFLISIESGIIQIGDSVFSAMGYASVVVGLLNSLLLISVLIANVNHFFTLLGKMFFTPYGKEFFSYSGKQIFTS